MNPSDIVEIQNLRHSYKDREVLKGLSLSVRRGEIFGFLGPNGSGKTTLFRILSTSFAPSSGVVFIDALDIYKEAASVRKKIGVVFQSPSLDAKLKVKENLMHQGHLYGLSGAALEKRSKLMLEKLGLTDRASERAEKLSGGLKRRVELAKGLLHEPILIILDEPSTGLDPGARIDLWKYLQNLRKENGVTILITTHLMEEAEECDRIAILNHGNLVSLGAPNELKRKVSKDIIVIKTQEADVLAAKIKEKFGFEALVENGAVQVEHDKGPELVAKLAEAFAGQIQAITYRKPTLEDVFLHETGHQFWEKGEKENARDRF